MPRTSSGESSRRWKSNSETGTSKKSFFAPGTIWGEPGFEPWTQEMGLHLFWYMYIYIYTYILESVGALRAPLILLLAYSLTTFLSSPRCTPSTHTPQPRAQENAIMSLKHSSLKSVAHPRNDNRHQSYGTWSWHYIQAWICRMWSRAFQLRWTQNQKLIARVTSVDIRQASYLCKTELTITKKRNETGHICS